MEKKIKYFHDRKKVTAYFGISRNLSKGDYKLKIYAKYNTKTISKIIPISLQSTPFPVIRLSFPKKKKRLLKIRLSYPQKLVF